jgi:hypothetical protein
MSLVAGAASGAILSVSGALAGHGLETAAVTFVKAIWRS